MDIRISPYTNSRNIRNNISFKNAQDKARVNEQENIDMSNLSPRDKRLLSIGAGAMLAAMGLTYGVCSAVLPDYEKEEKEQVLNSLVKTCDSKKIMDYTGDGEFDIPIIVDGKTVAIFDYFNGTTIPVAESSAKPQEFEFPDTTTVYEDI